MAQNEKSSARVAKVAAKVLSDKSASARERTLAASVLTQARDKKGGKKKG